MNFKDSQNFKDFLALYTKQPKRVIFFIGAGLSMPLFPSWTDFLKQLVNITDTKGKLLFEKEELLGKLDSGLDFLEIADYCADAIGINEYRDLIEKNFNKEFNYTDIPNAYKTLLKLQFKSIITTNYDRIPEVGGQGNFSCYTNKNISESLKAIEQGRKIVLKIHGDILNQDSIILTQKDFKTVIHNNNAVQSGLRSIFSTCTICFLGFGLSDPHFTLILEFLNTIHNGQNIIHYTFLPSVSAFKIQSIEKNYGIRVIEYTPTNNSHPEVDEFINILKGGEDTIASPQMIVSKETLLSTIEERIYSHLGIQSYYLGYNSDEKKITLNYFTRAGTLHEYQKEILSILKLFNFETSLIHNIKICIFIQKEPNINFTDFSPILLVCNGEYQPVKAFAVHTSKEIELWETLQFTAPQMIGNILFEDRVFPFPYISF